MHGAGPPAREAGKEFVRSVDRAFAIVRAFGRERPSLTLSQVAERTGLTRASARRFLLTLQSLGYVGVEERQFFLRPRILDLGFAYLSSVPVFDVVEAHMEAMVQQVQESSSASVLDGTDIIYTLRVPTKRIMSVQIEVGTRLPAYATSMGRVLLAALPPAQLDDYFSQAELEQLTPTTLTDKKRLRSALDHVRQRGWCLLDQELEVGVRSVAVPLHDHAGRVFAAMNISTNATRVPAERLLEDHLPLLRKTAAAIDEEIRARRSPAGPSPPARARRPEPA
ncbi:MAG: IclR family transcriptional regulator domain-containing protein [Acidimicrobiales bacterium]